MTTAEAVDSLRASGWWVTTAEQGETAAVVWAPAAGAVVGPHASATRGHEQHPEP